MQSHSYAVVWALVLSLVMSLPQAASAQILIEDATILTMAEQPWSSSSEPFVGYLLTDKNGRIAEVGAGPYSGARDAIVEQIDGSGKVLMPGFVSGHNHLWQSAFRGLAPDGELYPWLQKLHWTYGDFFVDGDFYWFTLHGALDQLQHGITTTYSHSQRLAGTEQQYLESLRAEADFSQHFIFSYNGDHRQGADGYRSDFANFMVLSEQIMAEENSSMLAPSMNSVGSHVSENALILEAELVEKYGLTAQIHYLESYAHRDEDQAQWPMMADSGILRKGTAFAHFIHTSDEILKDTADAGASMIWNPLSNGRLASGLADIPRYREMGVGVGMGVDGAASADIADPFENMRMGLYATRMQHKRADVMGPSDVLYLHTLGTAKVLDVDDQVGSLEKGKLADFLIVDPANPGTGAMFNPAAHLVFSLNSDNIESVYVAGVKRVENGLSLEKDMLEVQAQVERRVALIRARAAVAAE